MRFKIYADLRTMFDLAEPKAFTREEGGEWFPWSLDAFEGEIHAVRFSDGRIWDEVNGERSAYMPNKPFGIERKHFEMIRSCAMEAVGIYGEETGAELARVTSNIWNDHVAVQAGVFVYKAFKLGEGEGDGEG